MNKNIKALELKQPPQTKEKYLDEIFDAFAAQDKDKISQAKELLYKNKEKDNFEKITLITYFLYLNYYNKQKAQDFFYLGKEGNFVLDKIFKELNFSQKSFYEKDFFETIAVNWLLNMPQVDSLKKEGKEFYFTKYDKESKDLVLYHFLALDYLDNFLLPKTMLNKNYFLLIKGALSVILSDYLEKTGQNSYQDNIEILNDQVVKLKKVLRTAEEEIKELKKRDLY